MPDTGARRRQTDAPDAVAAPIDVGDALLAKILAGYQALRPDSATPPGDQDPAMEAIAVLSRAYRALPRQRLVTAVEMVAKGSHGERRRIGRRH